MSMLNAIVTGDHLIELEPPRATLDQARHALTNRMQLVPVESDVWGVVDALDRIDPGLRLFYDQDESIYILFWKGARVKDGVLCQVEDFVGAYEELDPRLIKLIERLDAQGRGKVDLQRELEKLEAEKDAENDWQMAQQTGAAAERLRHAIRVDLNMEGDSVQLSSSRGIAKARKEQRRREKQARRRNR